MNERGRKVNETILSTCINYFLGRCRQLAVIAQPASVCVSKLALLTRLASQAAIRSWPPRN